MTQVSPVVPSTDIRARRRYYDCSAGPTTAPPVLRVRRATPVRERRATRSYECPRRRRYESAERRRYYECARRRRYYESAVQRRYYECAVRPVRRIERGAQWYQRGAHQCQCGTRTTATGGRDQRAAVTVVISGPRNRRPRRAKATGSPVAENSCGPDDLPGSASRSASVSSR